MALAFEELYARFRIVRVSQIITTITMLMATNDTFSIVNCDFSSAPTCPTRAMSSGKTRAEHPLKNHVPRESHQNRDALVRYIPCQAFRG